MFYILSFILIFLLTLILFLKLHPVFGGTLSDEEKEMYRTFPNYVNGKFVNTFDLNMKMSPATIVTLMRDGLVGKEERRPKTPLPVSFNNKTISSEDNLTWFGHSTFLLNIDKKHILVDPMFGQTASPVSFAGSKRYSKEVLAIIDKLPPIDAVLITHDHYDHLDYPSILKLKEKVSEFFVPYGVGAHLVRWGIQRDKIREFNWWEEILWSEFTFSFVPSQHFSGRGITNRDSTLWGGWVILGKTSRIYVSGDGGYGPHFKQIGKKYGPFDHTIVEGGQYDPRWSAVHMQPEESVQAHLDVAGRNMILSHWGAFTLAYHSWKEPIERALVEAEAKGVTLITPKLGETVHLQSNMAKSTLPWWREKD
ncbi:MBL fold metallo-hydrolase [Bacillus luteolus]|uniref:MBL fold metallo-hydrolase n=1 Tax=Litchfieldia luteola TaxID=682179 RepID=A0ABR9QJ80_9BACI|nr:MBL fold metallo-hydrolase [Cytobacillus luteolus]MBE4908557.1 MBL fold metallo-hydrolase [Cytobacillus luteolus]MBP1941412.1 L-ascorbate metabolism protein UlaG (beta-lactamase superfamily) [Cytobacillus luteolus]